MKKHGTANILLMELLVVILFFMLCVSTLVEVLGLARGKSALARAENDAMLRVENLESLIREAGDMGETLKENGFEQNADRWTLEEETFVLHADITDEKTEAGILQTVTFTAERPDGTGLMELPVTRYIPGEVSP
ncbi:MAG: hypothetical protein IKE24_08055 [Clostridia bacterium]|nr:hypothetical protein [Clostridia bacterium]